MLCVGFLDCASAQLSSYVRRQQDFIAESDVLMMRGRALMPSPVAYVWVAFGLMALAIAACRDSTAPLPSGARRFDPPPVFARWWALTEACSERSGSFAAYSWYVVPGSYAPTPSTPNVSAYTDVKAHRIVLAETVWGFGGTVRHEMLHALLGRDHASGSPEQIHPPEYFQGRCKGAVACPESCASAGPAPVTAPADAPLLPVASLASDIKLLTSPASLAGSDSILSIIVRVTNPTANPAWVALEQSPVVSAPFTSYFSFGIMPAGRDTQLVRLVQSVPIAPVPFAAGQTRESVLDVNLRAVGLSPGDYVVTGGFNTRAPVSTQLRILP